MPKSRIIKLIKLNACFLRKDARIVFVCGRDTKVPGSKRKIFLDYAKRNITDVHFLLAEDVFKALEKGYGDLLSIEENLAIYSDCIIIILESESAFAELGAFAIKDELCKLIIPVNDIMYKENSSFITLGPLGKVDDGKSIFGKTIYTNMNTFSNCFPEIKERLKKIKLGRRRKLGISNYNDFKDNNKERMFLIHDIINILTPVKLKELVDIFKEIYGASARLDIIKLDIKLLEAIKLVQQHDGYYFTTSTGDRFVDFGWDTFTTLKAKQLLKYKRDWPERLAILGKVTQDATST